MAIRDGLLLFTGTSNGAAGGITANAHGDSPTTGTQVASNILDLGVTSGVPSSANGGGARDIGIGDDRAMKLAINVTTAFTGGTNLQFELAGAPDNGSGGQGAYTVMWTSQVIAEATLVVGQVANVDMPRVVPGQVLPRFLRMRFITVGTHTGGVVEGTLELDQFEQIIGPTGLISGYPAGITVAN